MKKLYLLFFFIPLLTPKLHSAEFSTTNLQLLRGHAYELVPDQDRYFITLEHFTAHKFGSVFAFVDVEEPFAPSTSLYGELVLNWSSSKIFMGGAEYSSFLKDISLAFSLEFSGTGAYLMGAAFDFNVPYFRIFRLSPYLRDVKDTSSASFQVTWVWNLPVEVGPTGWLFEGFLDYATGQDGGESTIIAQPRALFDLGKVGWNQSNRFWVGIEYRYMKNKFGVRNVDESVVQYMVKWVL